MLGSHRPLLAVSAAILAFAESGGAQVGYRDLDAGRREEILLAASRYRDSTSNITSVDEWRSMSIAMGIRQMGGLPAVPRGCN